MFIIRCLNRNKSKFYYATFVSQTPGYDEYENETGSPVITYSSPVEMKANISEIRGTADVELFGINLNYDKFIVTDEMDCPISESSVLWIDKTPGTPYNPTSPKHDFVVKCVAKSLNHIAYAVQRVDVS